MTNDARDVDSLLEAICDATLKLSQVGRLPEVLQFIGDTFRELLPTDYACLTTLEQESFPSILVCSGFQTDQARLLAQLLDDNGFWEQASSEQQIIQLSNLPANLRETRWPSDLPKMNRLMGLSIIQQGTVYGRIFVADEKEGRAFSSSDERLLQLFASQAAVAIQYAQLLHNSQKQSEQLAQRNRQLAALDKATMAIAGELTLDKVLQQIVDVARDLAEAQYAALGVPNNHGYLETFIDSGMPPEMSAQIPHLPKGLGLLGAIIQEQKTIRVPRISDDPRSVGFPEGHPPMVPFLGVPLIAGREILGNLYLTNKVDADEFTQVDQDLVELLAAHAAVAIQNARLYEQVGRLAIVEERTRIGMDLHDGIIQSIYAVGLTLESTKLSLPDDPEEADGLLTYAIEGLNATIRDIRNFILDLRPHRFQGNLEQGLGRLVREFQANTMVAVSLSAPKEALSHVPPHVARSLFLTTQEALANIARHAKARQVFISIEAKDNKLYLHISDDGRGFDMAAKSYSVGHGLSNMRARAEDLSGSFVIQSAPGKGTSVELVFPISEGPAS